MKKQYSEAQCGWCGELFYLRRPSDKKHKKNHYCCKFCSQLGTIRSLSIAMSGHPSAKANGLKNHHHLQTFLASNHPWNYSTVGKDRECAHCHQVFHAHPHKVRENKAKYCSQACYDAARHNPALSEEERLRGTPEYKAWRKAVFKRDNYTCTRCGNAGLKHAWLEAHHILQFKTHPALRFDVNNGETLCLQCHHEEHHLSPKVYGVCLDCQGRCGQRAKRCLPCEKKRRKRDAA